MCNDIECGERQGHGDSAEATPDPQTSGAHFPCHRYIWANPKATGHLPTFLMDTFFLYQLSTWNISEAIQQFPFYPAACLLLIYSVLSLLWIKVPLGTKSYIILFNGM